MAAKTRVSFYAEASAAEAIEDAADEKGVSVSEYIRSHLPECSDV